MELVLKPEALWIRLWQPLSIELIRGDGVLYPILGTRLYNLIILMASRWASLSSTMAVHETPAYNLDLIKVHILLSI